MTDTEDPRNRLQLRSGPLITGGVLVGAGAMLVLAGIAVGSTHVFSAIQRWVQEMEVPPSELARQKWAQAKTAAAAGTTAWRNGLSAADPQAPGAAD